MGSLVFAAVAIGGIVLAKSIVDRWPERKRCQRMKLWEKIALGGGIVGLITLVVGEVRRIASYCSCLGSATGAVYEARHWNTGEGWRNVSDKCDHPGRFALYRSGRDLAEQEPWLHDPRFLERSPSGWPAGDPFPTGYHIAVKNPIGTVTTVDAGVAVWATGGFTS